MKFIYIFISSSCEKAKTGNKVFNENMDRRFKCKKYEADFKSSSLLKLNIKEKHQVEL